MTTATEALKLAREALHEARQLLATLGRVSDCASHHTARAAAMSDRITEALIGLDALDALPAPSGEPAPTRADLIAALTFYATGGHMNLSDESAWDTVSGEPQNWWCDEAGTATIEDGSIAKMALAGDMNADHFAALERGDDVCIDPGTGHEAPQAAPAPQAASPAPAVPADLCERICMAIKEADDKSIEEAGYMLDSNDCIKIVRDQFSAAPQEAPARVPLTEALIADAEAAWFAGPAFAANGDFDARMRDVAEVFAAAWGVKLAGITAKESGHE